MARVHKYECHKNLHNLVDSTDFKSVLEEFFGSELGTYQSKEVDGVLFYYNTGIHKSIFGTKTYNRFSAIKEYGWNQTLTYEVLLDDDFKNADGFVDSDWIGYCFADLQSEVKRIIFKKQ